MNGTTTIAISPNIDVQRTKEVVMCKKNEPTLHNKAYFRTPEMRNFFDSKNKNKIKTLF
jgi:hypothetical protein